MITKPLFKHHDGASSEQQIRSELRPATDDASDNLASSE
jgi:hypothetical protein